MSPMDRRRLLRASSLAVSGLAAGCSAPTASSVPPTPVAAAPTVTPPQPTRAGTPSPNAVTGEIVHGPRDRPQVALTFHGQGPPQQVESLLVALEAQAARGTILAVGSWLQTVPDLAARILNGGHDLGNHTQNHIDISRSPRAKAHAEIAQCAAVLDRLTGSIGRWFRPSQTHHATSMIRSEAAKVGYRACLSYDVDSLDYTDPGPAAVTRTTLANLRAGSIVSLHCGHDGTIRALPAILHGLADRGLRAVTVTELLA